MIALEPSEGNIESKWVDPTRWCKGVGHMVGSCGLSARGALSKRFVVCGRDFVEVLRMEVENVSASKNCGSELFDCN